MIRKIIIVVVCSTTLAVGAFAQPKNVVFKTLNNYFLADNSILSGNVTCKVIAKEKDFNKMFGIAKTMTNKIDKPDFATQQVLMIALQPTNKKATVTIVSALHAGNFIEVYFTTSKERYPMPYTTQPLAIAVVPKYKEVTKVRFYNDKRLVEEVGIK